MPTDTASIAARLIAAYDSATTLAPITASEPGFDVAAAYAVLREIEGRRRAQGWSPVGRKIGFTNRTIWQRYGVWEPMWATTWRNTVHFVTQGKAILALERFVQPRIEPEVVFRLRSGVPAGADAARAFDCVDWIAAGFEIVQSHFPDWKFAAADCTAAFGLHGALVVGTPVAVTDANRARLSALLPSFELSLSRDGTLVEKGIGANVLDGPAHALAHLARLVAGQSEAPPLAAGELITTGTLTDAWPVGRGETWSSAYGTLGIAGIRLSLA